MSNAILPHKLAVFSVGTWHAGILTVVTTFELCVTPTNSTYGKNGT